MNKSTYDEPWIVRGRIYGNRIAIGEAMGKGGQSSVHRGKVVAGPDEGCDLAVKFLSGCGDPEREGEALREMRILGGMQVAGVPRFVDFGTLADSRTWLAMQLVEGTNLRDYVRYNGPLQGPTAEYSLLAILYQLARIVATLGKTGILHRDVKPGNVVVDEREGRLWLVDFGLAKAKSDGHLTRIGAIKGTPAFLAPEAIVGKTCNASDLYGAAAVVYFCATGKPPHEVADSRNYWQVVRTILESRPQSLSKACPGVFTKQFSALIGSAMHPDHQKRPSPNQLVEQIDALIKQPRRQRA